jgi:hypothetical protein
VGKLGRDVYRRKLSRHLSQSVDESMIHLIAALVAIQAGRRSALAAVVDLPENAVGAEFGSRYHIVPWRLETLANELLATPKARDLGIGRTRLLRSDLFETARILTAILGKLENAEDGIFLNRYNILYEMSRIAQRQFPWQRGVANAPNLYRSALLYGSGRASAYFEKAAGLSVSGFMKAGSYFAGALSRAQPIDRFRDLSELGLTSDIREAALRKLAIGHADARALASSRQKARGQTAYRPSLLRDFPILSFGDRDERLRAPLPELITYRYTTGLYLDIVSGGGAVWTEIGKRFEGYVQDYLAAMMPPYVVGGEFEYGPKKARVRTPDVLVSNAEGVVAAVECKAKRMSFGARFADDPIAEAADGFQELSKGICQLWRFLADARLGRIRDVTVAPDCQAIIVTADSWLTMARIQAEKVIEAAHTLADAANIDQVDRRPVAFCPIDDVEYALQHGTADSFLAACRDIASGDKNGWMLSVAHVAEEDGVRPYPFMDRLFAALPWMEPGNRRILE